MVIIGSNYAGLEFQMLHTKFRENRPAGSGEEDFNCFYHIWAWRHLDRVPLTYISRSTDFVNFYVKVRFSLHL